MIDLKPFYDSVIATDAEVKRIAGEIGALIQSESDEDKKSALAMRPALEEAQNKADDSLKLYEAMKKASAPNNSVMPNFIPATETDPDPEADNEQPQGIVKRNEFEAMSPRERMAHIKNGGRVED